jgi:ligand-binding sensor domain-containing protein/serine phosphatase RsbU (regulator of sigma subunit)
VVHDRESGIAGIKINDIDQDDNGYLWIATNSGLSRFDGKNFVNYFEKNGLSENHCTTVFCGDDGRVWVGHQTTGISIIRGKSLTNLSEETGLANNEIHDIFESTDGSIWVATFGGVSILNGEEWETITTADGLSSNNIQVVAQDTDNRIWLGSYGTGITILDNGVAKSLHRGHGLTNNYVTSLVSIGDRMLIGTLGGLSAWRKSGFSDIPGIQELSNNQINGVAIGSNEAIWLATFNGANRLLPKNVLSITEENGLPKNEISDVFIDVEDNVWLGTQVGLIRIKNLAFSHHFSNEEIDIYPSSLFADKKGQLWVGNEAGGVLSFDGINFVSAFEDPDINNHQISSICEDSDGNLWFGTMDFGGLFQWDGDKFYIYSDEFGLADNNINCLATDEEGVLLIGTPNGLSTFDGVDFQIVYLSDNLASNHVTCIEPSSDGSFLIGAEDGSIFKYQASEATQLDEPVIHSRITDIATSENTIAYGSNNHGIWIDQNREITYLSEENGLLNGSIRSLIFQENRLIAGTSNGILEVVFEEDSFRVEKHTRSDGFLGGSCNQAAIIQYDSEILFGTEKGIVEFSSSEINRNQNSPKTTLTELQLSYEHVDWLQKGYEVTENGLPTDLSLPYTDNTLRFFFTGVNHRSPDQVRYKWKLEGYENDWTPYSDQNLVNYPSLPAGDYAFSLIACNGTGVCSEEPIQYSFSISPPFWRTWWFYTLLIIAVVVGTYFYVKQREQRLLEEKEILESTVEERTKELREQKEIIEHQNQHITEGIEYASNIQKAILPSEEEMNTAFNGHFAFYRPKDVVGGDFYWTHHDKDIAWGAAVDCTGHGVSGAFMSMIGSDLLNQIIIEKKINNPAKVLEEMDKGIKLAFAQSAKEFESDQGMDVTLVRIDRKKNSLLFAGAQRPLFIFIDGELTEIEGDRYSISCADEMTKSFESHEVKYSDDSVIYLFSDGITDQFGGPKRKKFMVRRVREFLVKNHGKGMEEQHQAFIKTFDDWKGEDNQIDDVMLMGIRL